MRSHAKAAPAVSTPATSRKASATIALLAACALALFLAPSALAAYTQVGTFADNGPGSNGSGSADGELSLPGALDVNNATKKIYVADTKNDRVQSFSKTATGGSFSAKVAITAPKGLEIDQATGSVYVSNASGVSKFDQNLNQILAPAWIDPGVSGPLAVDPTNGDLLVGDQGANLIRRFSSNGTPGATFASERPVDIAVDSTGKAYVVTSTGDITGECGPTSTVKKYSSAGALEATVGASLHIPGAVSVDPDDGSIVIAADVGEYACNGSNYPEIAVFDSSGTLRESFELTGFPDKQEAPTGDLLYAMVSGLAATGGSPRLYAATTSPADDEYGNTRIIAFEDRAKPEVTIDPVDPGGVSSFEATFEGEVDPNGAPTEWHFEYRIVGAEQWTHSPRQSAGSAPGAQQAGYTVTGLRPNKTYEVRLVASSTIGTSDASDEPNPIFTTNAAAPLAKTLPASKLRPTGALVRASLNPFDSPTEYWFEWGISDCSSNACTSIPLTQDASAGSGSALLQVSRQLEGLSPQSTYHFRVIARNAIGTTEGEDLTFTTPSATTQCANAGSIGVGFLPDCRAWEMVSPQDKNGGNVIPSLERSRIATTGNAASFSSLTGFAGTEGMGVAAGYLAKRSNELAPGTQGWTTRSIMPPQEQMNLFLAGGAEPRYVGRFSDDLSKSIFLAISPLNSEGDNVAQSINLYRRDDLLSPGIGNYQLLTDCLSPPNGPCASPIVPTLAVRGFAMAPIYAGSSSDLDHIIFESLLVLSDGAPPTSKEKLYETTGGAPRLAGILPSGDPASESLAAGRGGLLKAGEGKLTLHPPISKDGSRIFFTDPTTGRLYLRIGGRSTVQLNASERSPSGGELKADYWDASADGRRVFFTSAEALTDDAPTGPAKLYMWKQAGTDETQSVTVNAGGGDFTLSFNDNTTAPIPYGASPAAVEAALESLASVKSDNVAVAESGGSYLVTFTGDFAGMNVAPLSADDSGLSGGTATATVVTTEPVHNLTFLSVDEEPTDDDNGYVDGVVGVVGASADGSRAYFVADSQLVNSAAPFDFNTKGLYLWDEGQIDFVGVLATSAFGTSYPDSVFFGGENRRRQTYVTPGGDLIFAARSGGGLLSAHGGVDFDHGTACKAFAERGLGADCGQLYIYSADSGDLQCASCGAPGTLPGSQAVINVHTDAGGSGSSAADRRAPRALSDDGRYAFFSTAARLVSEDTNGTWDAYVYDIKAGKPNLLSSGESPGPSYFIDATPDGKGVFFTTTERLSDWDIDGNTDLYVARVGGGFPEPPPPPPSCQGDACQPSPQNLNDPTPSSSGSQGTGDTRTSRKAPNTRCAKGSRKVRSRNGKTRCVKKHKRNSNKRTANSDRRAGR